MVSLIAPFTIPIITAMSMVFFMENATEFSLPIVKTIVQLLVITVVPVALGMFVFSRWPVISAKIERP